MDEHAPGSLGHVTKIAVAWLKNPGNQIAAEDLPSLLQHIQQGIAAAHSGEGAPGRDVGRLAAPTPAVSVEDSLASADHIVSLIDGRPYKALRLHLAKHGLTPDEYRTRYGLRHDYPMVAPNHSAARRAIAKSIGFGTMHRGRRNAG